MDEVIEVNMYQNVSLWAVDCAVKMYSSCCFCFVQQKWASCVMQR
jgi:hypothetical protein